MAFFVYSFINSVGCGKSLLLKDHNYKKRWTIIVENLSITITEAPSTSGDLPLKRRLMYLVSPAMTKKNLHFTKGTWSVTT